MYYPTLRGKQFELIALRELSSRIDKELFCPIIEPVRSKLQALGKTISFLNEADIAPIVIVNPSLGDFSEQSFFSIESKLRDEAKDLRFMPCFSTKKQSTESLQELISSTTVPFAIFVEEGLSREMLPLLSDASLVITTKYQRSAFKSIERVVIVEDNFTRASRNSDYPERSYFSDRHTEYQEGKNVCGYGDYTITGNDFLESGGPAFVVTIHLSYIDPDEFDAMYIRHFKSFDDNSPTRPGEKFGDALKKLIDFCDSNPELFERTLGLDGFRKLKSQDHFPGLGQVKKLSIQHHIETLAKYGAK
ncbi:sce7725 family protein [Vibrio vulnificus]|uniref:sce7725 family protein n=1 Tax=Vibrio vulnificus TaxID=672 RepID=UPI000CCFF419|nr:sce7725 family protein [Vibrio vulnificus]EGR0208219.1 sce7725 family protein [Vibrio vulnificus]EHH1180557.1 sce7725 family protein [Vibrio vulnificus]EHH1191745.1 sce7725 family protein [Vibrio vulnificus]EHU4849218.1 sce7725 family protein [Vibrio vulnificus]EHU4867919.1 sce7725 family protein [Vibrio vulnificus]